MRAHLTDITVRSLKPTDNQTKVWDTQTRGFGVRVNGSTKSWIVMYGNRRQLKTLGRYPDMPLSEARKEAKRLLAAPAEAPKTKEITLEAALADFDRLHLSQRQGYTTRKETLRMFSKHFPTLSAKNVSQLDFGTIMGIVDKLLDRPSEATHAFKAMRVFLNWCVRRQLIATNPLAGIPLPAPDNKRDRVLTIEEIKALWHKAEGTYGQVWRLLLLTGQRRSQIFGLEHEWVKDGSIEFPSHIMKGKNPHIIPLGELSKAIIEGQPKGRFVFPAKRADHIKDNVDAQRKHDKAAEIKTHYVLHDLRRTMASIHASIGTPIHVIEKLLHHTSGTFSGVVGIYQRYSFQKEMAAAVQAYETHLNSLLSTSG